MKSKLSSRKFWICVAAFLASVATSISGIATSNEVVIVIGTVAGILSAAIYSACEAFIDAKAVGGDTYVNELHFDKEKEEDE